MGKYAAWVGSTLISLVSLAVSIPPIIESWPRWVLLAVGFLVGAAVIATFPRVWRSQEKSPCTTSINQRLRAGHNSRIIQTTKDVHIEGGMGDS
jgi:protein-S-isoprenylcysteine O-methyltransferase Ste14